MALIAFPAPYRMLEVSGIRALTILAIRKKVRHQLDPL